MISSSTEPMAPGRTRRYLSNVFWSWLGVGINLFSAAILSPYIIHKLGVEGYGIWVLVFTLVEFFCLADLGFRSAVVKFSAHYLATEEEGKVNEVINSGLVYFASMACLVAAAAVVLAQHAHRFLQIPAEYLSIFSTMVLLIGLSWTAGMLFNVFQAALEGFQRFDLVVRIWILTTAIRSIGCFVVLALGYGLIEMTMLVVGAQLIGYFLYYLAIRHVFPPLRLSLRAPSTPMLRQMGRFGIHNFVAFISTLVLTHSPLLLIGHLRPVVFAGYFALPLRLMLLIREIPSRVAVVTGSASAQLWAKQEFNTLAQIATHSNSYCYALILPAGLFLAAYHHELMRLWIGPEFALHSAPLLPVLFLGVAVAVAGQYNSGAILIGTGNHQRYSRGLLAEAVLGVALLYYVIPRYGLLAAAWVTSVLMILNRGLVASWLLCHYMKLSWPRFLGSIYLRPTATALPVFGLLVWLKRHWLGGQTWVELVVATALTASVYYALAFFVCLREEHRGLLWQWGSQRWRKFS
jgi:O-antigen/teichoic acid export membrane protein